VRMKSNAPGLSLSLIVGCSLVLVAVLSGPCRSQSTDPDCAAKVDQWTKAFQLLEDKINDLTALQQARVERVTQRQLPDGAPGKTIAKQISDALQVKEDLINSKRRECREILAQEEQIFSQVQDCLSNGRDSRNKDAKKLIKHRNALLEKAAPTLADVKEVEGKDTGMPYSEAMRGPQDMSRGGPNNYWQSYQQMYRRWWGY